MFDVYIYNVDIQVNNFQWKIVECEGMADNWNNPNEKGTIKCRIINISTRKIQQCDKITYDPSGVGGVGNSNIFSTNIWPLWGHGGEFGHFCYRNLNPLGSCNFHSTINIWCYIKLHSWIAIWCKIILHSRIAIWSNIKLHSRIAIWSNIKLHSRIAIWCKSNYIVGSLFDPTSIYIVASPIDLTSNYIVGSLFDLTSNSNPPDPSGVACW